MADIEQQMREDRALRNAAKQLVSNGIGHIKGDMSQKGLGARILGRAKDGAAEIADNSSDFAKSNSLKVGGGIALGILALGGWMFRDQIADAIANLMDGEDEHEGEFAGLTENDTDTSEKSYE